MKKFLIALVLGATLALTACSSFFSDPVTVHNGLVDRMDGVLAAEQAFYDEYFGIKEGDLLIDLDRSVTAFAEAVTVLDDYFKESKFDDSQQSFVTGYNDEYKAVVEAYLADAQAFVADVKGNGNTFDLAFAEGYFPKLDEHATAFVDAHNKLIDTINLQADY